MAETLRLLEPKALSPRIIGDELLARDENGRLRTRIATVFPRSNTIITLPGIHATQRVAYVDALNSDRTAAGLEPITEEEEENEWLNAVDLVIEEDSVLIRPDPAEMELAFEADELLQQVVSKKKIRFLHVLDRRVRDAIRKRGECWRISPLPRSPDEMKRMIAASRIAISDRELYYYNSASGTRFLTLQQFRELDSLPDDALRNYLEEISRHACGRNRLGNPEVDFFAAGEAGLSNDFGLYTFAAFGPTELRAAYQGLLRKFRDAVPPELRDDDPQSAVWRSRMYAALIGKTDRAASEEELLGLSAEFFMQMEWLPGGRIEDGELLLDSVFEEEDPGNCAPSLGRICDDTARGFIFNFIRDYGDLEYVNVGRIAGSLSQRKTVDGRRGVYLAEVKQRGNEKPILRILRMQKWGVAEHLDEGKDLLRAILEAEEYTEYILNRRLGCRQLGMSLCPRATTRKVRERYWGTHKRYEGEWIWSAYFERDYIGGLATDKIPSCRFAEDDFALRFARLMGRAAAPNLILGRTDLRGNVIFDDGDELILEDAAGLPIDIMVADHTGTFNDYRRDLTEAAPAYADPINRRRTFVNSPAAFSEAYLAGFVERFSHIQRDYRKRRRGFQRLFKHERRDEGGSFAYRWERIVDRLHLAEPQQLAERIRANLHTA